MKKSIVASVTLGIVLLGMATAAQAGTVTYSAPIYQAGSNLPGSAYDYDTKLLYGITGAPYSYTYGGDSTISWEFTPDQTGYATLSITAEGIDVGELDEVSYQFGNSNKIVLGNLNQTDYRPTFYLHRGDGAIADITAITTTEFYLDLPVEAGITYTFTVSVPEGEGGVAWVNEIETSTLTVTTVPTQTSMLLLGTGLVGLAAVGRRKQA